jgi:hypothetical protein
VAILAPVVLGLIHGLASLERAAFRDAQGTGLLLGGFLLMWGGLRALDLRKRELQRAAGEPVEWDEIPAIAQRMDLSG